MERGIWLNEPQNWSAGETGLRLTTLDKTDFWRETHYGFTHDDGHFLGVRAEARSPPACASRASSRRSTTRPG